MDVNKAWDNVIKHEGAVFKTVTNLDFTYTMNSKLTAFTTNRGKASLTKKNFEKAYSLLPVSGPTVLGNNGVYGHSYVYALLTDNRIMLG